MKTFANYIEALQIFAKYSPNATHVLHAEHDILYAHAEPSDIGDEDTARLEVLGWTEDADGGFSCFT